MKQSTKKIIAASVAMLFPVWIPLTLLGMLCIFVIGSVYDGVLDLLSDKRGEL